MPRIFTYEPPPTWSYGGKLLRPAEAFVKANNPPDHSFDFGADLAQLHDEEYWPAG